MEGIGIDGGVLVVRPIKVVITMINTQLFQIGDKFSHMGTVTRQYLSTTPSTAVYCLFITYIYFMFRRTKICKKIVYKDYPARIMSPKRFSVLR